jgi:dienelactone hydrolase
MIVALSRCILALVCAAVLCTACAAAEVQSQELLIEASDRTVVVTRYAVAGATQRPAVVILHGSSGLDAGRELYARHAQTLAENGIDAYVISYFGPRSNVGSLHPHLGQDCR